MGVVFSEFLDGLFTDGRVRVASLADISDTEGEKIDEALVAFEQNYRRGLPGTPPPIFLSAARWAATVFYRICQFTVFRDLDEETISRALATRCPAGDPPSVHYSVDLTFRFLPDAVKLARGASAEDPLLRHLMRLANEWPLSSVGIAGMEKFEISSWINDPSLRGLYVDRVIAYREVSRINDPLVRQAVEQALGVFPDLAPAMAAACAGGANPQDNAMENVP
jgi:hypothetical protein